MRTHTVNNTANTGPILRQKLLSMSVSYVPDIKHASAFAFCFQFGRIQMMSVCTAIWAPYIGRY